MPASPLKLALVLSVGLALATRAAVALPCQGPPQDQDPAEIDQLVKAATKKFPGPALANLVKQVEDKIKSEVVEYGADSGWIASTRALAARLATPVTGVPIEFGPIRTTSAKTGHAPLAKPNELFRPRLVAYRFGMRDYSEPTRMKPIGPIEPKDVPPEQQLAWLLSGHPPEVELAIAAIQRELDVDRSRDKLSRFLEYWRNGREAFYDALDRTAGTKEAVFFFDAMLGEFVDKLAPELLKVRTLSEKHDRLHEAFLTVRQYRRVIEATSLALVSTDPLPLRLKDFDYSVIAGSAQLRDAFELAIASRKGDLAAVAEDLKAVLAANPMPAELWGKYDPPSILMRWYQENSAKFRSGIPANEAAGLNDVTLAVRLRTARRAVEQKIRAAARASLEEHGVAAPK